MCAAGAGILLNVSRQGPPAEEPEEETPDVEEPFPDEPMHDEGPAEALA